jgi:hypothetical protein
VAWFDDRRFRGLRQLWRSGEGPALLASLLFCVITSIFMAPMLPAEDGYGMVGVLFIYATVFVLVAGMFRMAIAPAMRRWQKVRAGSDDAA